jgi:signal peptidase II
MANPAPTRDGLSWLWLSGLVIALDQISKLAIRMGLEVGDYIPVLPFFNIVRMHNTGAAFSLLADQPGWQRGFFIAVSLAASVFILHLLRKAGRRPAYCMALALILGGAVGNLIDRIWLGHVVDFLDFFAGSWHWPAFNVADSAITVGAALLIWDALRGAGEAH